MKLTMKRLMLAFLLVVVAFAAFACKKDNKDDNKPDDNKTDDVTAVISLAKESYALEVGDSVTLADTVTAGFELEYSVDKADVLDISGKTVTAKKEGTAKVTVKVKGQDITATITVTVTAKVEFGAVYTTEDDYKAYVTYDLDLLYGSIVNELTADQKTAVEKAYNDGKAAIDAAKTLAAVRQAYKDAEAAVAACVPLAEGLITYMAESTQRKTEILGILENFTVTTGITGISLFENGRYVMYNERVTLGTETYITGYGFGVLAEGQLTAPLEYETNEAWKMYYHTLNPKDPGTANYLNDQGSEVADFYGYIGSSLYTNFMNETKNGYDWVPELAITERPIALDEDYAETGYSASWKVEVRTGKTGLKYNTNSTLRAAFNNRPVELEDYVTPFKLLLTKANNLYRGSEMASSTSNPILGAKEYYEASADGFNAEAWEKVGIKVGEEDGKEYFYFTFGKKFTQFNAMYYISSSLYAPIPQAFLDEVTVKNYLGFNEDKSQTPVDNSLSLGAYTLEAWNSDREVVYKKNPNYVYADTKYAVQGIVITILAAMETDTNAGIKEFLAGHTDAAGIPQDYLEQYKSDPRTRQTTGSSNFKLNVNATSEETWEELFGENGVVTQTAKEKYWDVKPALSNKHFVRGLSYAIDRLEFASARGRVPSVNYFASSYMSDNENGISYNGTDEHKAAVKQLLEDTDGYGFSLQLAQDYFKMALDELVADGAYTPGTKENPTVISIEIAWMYPTDQKDYHDEIKKYLEEAFNDEAVSGGVFELEISFWVGAQWSDVYYNKLMVGQYDLGFGAISGDTLNPLSFMNVLSSDTKISGNFTLNWGVNTNDVDAYPLVFDGKRWSYDGLYTASQQVAIISEGQNKPMYLFDYSGLTVDADGNYVATATFTFTLPELTEIDLDDIALCNYARYYGAGKYEEFYLADFEGYTAESSLSEDGKVLTISVKVTKEVALQLHDHYVAACDADPETDVESDYIGYMGFDFYYVGTFNGEAAEGYEPVSDYFKDLVAEPAE